MLIGLLIWGFFSSVVGQQPIVTTKTGQLRGKVVDISPKLKAYQFTSVPFAEPPTGNRRFRKPVAKEPWDGVLDATTMPNSCPQLNSSSMLPFRSDFTTDSDPTGHQNEDCLYLNIWVPKEMFDSLSNTPDEPPSLLPVFVYIHPGIFSNGASTLSVINGSMLATYNNIIVVSIQHRLGALGFAYMDNEQIPGNMGLWDQVEALKWLCENIGNFGGNCSETTLGGHGSGATSVTLHLLSKHSRRYFKRAIVQSGSALMPFGVNSRGEALQSTDDVIRMVCPNAPSSENDKIDCLMNCDENCLPLAQVQTRFGLLPVIDGDFLEDDPTTLLLNGDFYQVPMIVGATKDEGSTLVALNPNASIWLPNPMVDNDPRLVDRLNFTHYNSLMSHLFEIFSGSAHFDPILYSAVQLNYWPTKHDGFPEGNEVIRAAVAAASDYSTTCPTLSWLHYAAQASRNMGQQTFAYHFTQRRARHPWPTWMGVMHGDDIPYIFGQPLLAGSASFGYSFDDRLLSRVMMAQWSNFIKYGYHFKLF